MSCRANQYLRRPGAIRTYGSTADSFFQSKFTDPNNMPGSALGIEVDPGLPRRARQGTYSQQQKENPALAFQNDKRQNGSLSKGFLELKAGKHQPEWRPTSLPGELMKLVPKNECDFQRAAGVPNRGAVSSGQAGSRGQGHAGLSIWRVMEPTGQVEQLELHLTGHKESLKLSRKD